LLDRVHPPPDLATTQVPVDVHLLRAWVATNFPDAVDRSVPGSAKLLEFDFVCGVKEALLQRCLYLPPSRLFELNNLGCPKLDEKLALA